MGSQTWNTPGTTTFTVGTDCPSSVTSLQIEVWQQGASGADQIGVGGAGGGGGSYARKNSWSVGDGNGFDVTIPAANATGANGASPSCYSQIDDFVLFGDFGESYPQHAIGQSGGAAGDWSSDASNITPWDVTTAGTAGDNGVALASGKGGDCGNGGLGGASVTGIHDGNNGAVPGGGGSGAGVSAGALNPGTGGNAQVRFTWASAYSVSADSGSFTFAGTAAGLRADRNVSAASGTFAMSGTAVTLQLNRNLPASSGAFVLTGSDNTADVDADSNAFVLTGGDAGLIWGSLDPSYIDPAGNPYTFVAPANGLMTVEFWQRGAAGGATRGGGGGGYGRIVDHPTVGGRVYTVVVPALGISDGYVSWFDQGPHYLFFYGANTEAATGTDGGAGGQVGTGFNEYTITNATTGGNGATTGAAGGGGGAAGPGFNGNNASGTTGGAALVGPPASGAGGNAGVAGQGPGGGGGSGAAGANGQVNITFTAAQNQSQMRQPSHYLKLCLCISN